MLAQCLRDHGAARPTGVILQHAPGRPWLEGCPGVPTAPETCTKTTEAPAAGVESPFGFGVTGEPGGHLQAHGGGGGRGG